MSCRQSVKFQRPVRTWTTCSILRSPGISWPFDRTSSVSLLEIGLRTGGRGRAHGGKDQRQARRTAFDPKRTSGRHPNKPFQSGIVSLSAGWVGRMRQCEFLGVLGGAAATLAVCTTVLNAADEKAFEKALLGHIMWSAFQCSTYAELSDYKSEQERLHLVGLNAGRTFLEAMKAGQISEQALREAVPINVLQRLEGPSNEVIIDKIYAAATGYARDYIVKRKTGIWGPTEKQEARSYYTNHNCILIR